MRKILIAVLACLALGAGAPGAAQAQEEESQQVAKNVFMSVGFKTWINTWQTNLTGTGTNWTQQTQGPVLAYIPNLSFKVNNFIMTGSYMATGDYHFPRNSFYTVATPGVLISNDVTGNRQEGDFNIGYDLHPSQASSLVLTMGYKGVQEHFIVYRPNSNTTTDSKVHYNGITFGIAGGVSIGHGLSIYGNGVGGWMAVTYTPASTYLDNAQYEASELGLAWKSRSLPLSLSAGYKFQLIETHINSLNSSAYSLLPRSDVTRGWMLGANFVF